LDDSDGTFGVRVLLLDRVCIRTNSSNTPSCRVARMASANGATSFEHRDLDDSLRIDLRREIDQHPSIALPSRHADVRGEGCK
jgi:hypothetical protein